MTLIDAYYEPCVLLEKSRVADGEGGWNTVWVDGPTFKAAVVMDTTMEARVAEMEGMSSVYTVTVAGNVTLDFHDVFRRVADGKTFRVTSESSEKRTPSVASFDIAQVSAEPWELA